MRSLRWHAAALLCAGACLATAAASADDATFRDLARKYFKDGDGGELAKLVGYSQPVKQVIALEYKVLLFKDGKETPVDPKTYDFRIGDKIRVEIAAAGRLLRLYLPYRRQRQKGVLAARRQ